MLERWARSRVPVQRTVLQALRRLTLAVWYGHPAVQRALGHRGPLHPRAPAVRWEGPAEGVSTADVVVGSGAGGAVVAARLAEAEILRRSTAPNDYVADGSLFPTGLGVNPQATSMALAHLVADGLAARRR